MARFSHRQDDGEGGSQQSGPLPKKSRTHAPLRIIEPSSLTGRNRSGNHIESDRNSASRSSSPERQSSVSPRNYRTYRDYNNRGTQSPSRSRSMSRSRSPYTSRSRSRSRSRSPVYVVGDHRDENDDVRASSSSIRGSGVMLSDSDVLDCPICTVPLTPPVYQCENGHLACDSCCIEIDRKCPSCRLPVQIRCRGMEKVLEVAKASCKNTQYGCKEKTSYAKKLDHEKTCIYDPCSCPAIGCNYVGNAKRLCAHFHVMHRHDLLAFRFNSALNIEFHKEDNHQFLQEWEGDALFILNHSSEPFGRLLNVVCIAPTSSKTQYSYDLEVKVGNTTVNLKSVAKPTPNWSSAQLPNEKHLIVPNYLIQSDYLDLVFTIRKNPAVEGV